MEGQRVERGAVVCVSVKGKDCIVLYCVVL